MRALVRVAAALGVRLHATHLDEQTLGLYSPDEQRIYFDIRLTPNERRVTIAHELGHAYYGHDHSNPKHERQAEVFAAELLIDPEKYARLERVDPDQHRLADDLGVTVELIRTYEEHCLERVRGMTYTRARMGAGQWEYRGVRADAESAGV